MPLRFTRLPFFDLELLHALDIAHEYPQHLHENVSIGVVIRGEERIHCAATTLIAKAGSAFVIAADEMHGSTSIGSEYQVVKIRPALFDAAAIRTQVIDDGATVSRCIRSLEVAVTEEDVRSSLVNLLRSLRTAVAEEDPVRDYLKAHAADRVSLADLTRLAGCSAFHLARAFRSRAGIAPHQYQTQMRVAHARKLLRDGVPAADAALQAGFADQSHLSRHFKRIVGMTPGAYAAASKNVQDERRSSR